MMNTSPGKWELSKRLRPQKGPIPRSPRPLSDVAYAGPDDLEGLIAFLYGVRDEIDGGRAEQDLIADLAHELTHRIRGVAFIVRGPLGIEASLGLRADRTLLSRVHFLRATWLVVAPEARRTGHAKSLLIKGREFAVSMGRPLIVEEFTPDMADGKVKLVGRHLEQAGALFRYQPAVEAV